MTLGTPRLKMPAFSAAFLASVSPSYSDWSVPMGVSTAARGLSMWCVEPAAEADLEQQHVRRVLRVEQERRRRGDLEDRDRRSRIGFLASAEGVDEGLFRDQPAATGGAETDALVEAHEVGRGIDVDREAGRFEHRAHEGDGRALAVRAGDMDDRRQAAMRLAHGPEEALQAPERQVDQLGMKREKARQNRV